MRAAKTLHRPLRHCSSLRQMRRRDRDCRMIADHRPTTPSVHSRRITRAAFASSGTGTNRAAPRDSARPQRRRFIHDSECQNERLPLATENHELSSSANPWSAAAGQRSREGGPRAVRGLGQTGIPARATRFDGTGAPLGHRQSSIEQVPGETSKTSDYPAGNARSCSTSDHQDHRLQATGAVTQSRGTVIGTEMPAPQPSASRPKNKKTI